MADNEKKINLDLTVSSSPKKSMTGARIILNVKPPKNWRANSALRQDKTYQQMQMDLHKETDPQREKQLIKEIKQYKAKRLKELGFMD